jgi:hypothetical protein
MLKTVMFGLHRTDGRVGVTPAGASDREANVYVRRARPRFGERLGNHAVSSSDLFNSIEEGSQKQPLDSERG